MHHTKLIVFGVILLLAIVFAGIFWGDFILNQIGLANTPLSPSTDPLVPVNKNPDVNKSDSSYDTMEADLDSTDVNGVDSGNSNLEAGLNAL